MTNDWIFYALCAPALSAIITYIDKLLIEAEIKDYNAMPIYVGIVSFIAGIIFFIITGFPILSIRDATIVLITGALSTFATVLYFKALSFEETSKINFLLQMFPIISLVLAYLFLGETITIIQFIGFMLVISSGIGISLNKEHGKIKLSQAFLLILVVDVLWAIAGVLMKFAININSFSHVLCYESFGIAVGALLVFLVYSPARNAWYKSIKSVQKKTLSIIFINEGIFVLAKAVTFFAFSIGPVALVSVLEGTQTYFALAYGFLLTFLFPTIFKEDIRKKEIMRKLFFATLTMYGIILLY